MKRPFDSQKAHEYPIGTGTDEVGRGCLCGPVVVASVWFNPRDIPGDLLEALDDSKKLGAKTREDLASRIRACTEVKVSVAASSARKIDQINIRMATLDAMRRSVINLGIEAHIYIDGKDVPTGLPCPATAVIKGDGSIPQIAAASIIAKVVRDNLLCKLALRYPAYGWESNAGYGAKIHLEAIAKHGATKHHRMSFAPLKTPKEALEPELLLGL